MSKSGFFVLKPGVRGAAFLLVWLLAGCQIEGIDSPRTIRAYSWSQVDPGFDFVVPFHWLRMSDLEDVDGMLAAARRATAAMPIGHKVLFSWDLHRDMAWHPEDVLRTPAGEVAGCRDEAGNFKPWRSLWWDHGVERVQKRIDEWFRRYAAAGGKVDVVVLDFEQGYSYWHLLGLAQREYPSCGIGAYLQAIQDDPRFRDLVPKLGFGDLLKLDRWYESDEFLRWSGVTHEMMAENIRVAVYEPIRRHFPEVKFSNYGYYYQDPSFGIPDQNGYDSHRYDRGRHVGTHQARQFYGWIGQLESVSLDGRRPYAATPFNAFRYELNKLRAMKLSSPVPIFPWVANKEFGESRLRDSDLYQELIYHIALTGVDDFLFWNPLGTSTPATKFSNRLLNDLLAEIDELAGGAPLEGGANGIVPWLQPWVLTRGLAEGCSIWRFTPLLAEGEEAASFIVQRDPARFRVRGEEISIANGRVIDVAGTNSTAGVWVRQRDCIPGAGRR